MPITASAHKKLRQDKKRRVYNKQALEHMRQAVRSAKAHLTKETLTQAYSAIDRATKKQIIHKNKAARLKSRLTKSKSKVKSEK